MRPYLNSLFFSHHIHSDSVPSIRAVTSVSTETILLTVYTWKLGCMLRLRRWTWALARCSRWLSLAAEVAVPRVLRLWLQLIRVEDWVLLDPEHPLLSLTISRPVYAVCIALDVDQCFQPFRNETLSSVFIARWTSINVCSTANGQKHHFPILNCERKKHWLIHLGMVRHGSLFVAEPTRPTVDIPKPDTTRCADRPHLCPTLYLATL